MNNCKAISLSLSLPAWLSACYTNTNKLVYNVLHSALLP